MPTTPCSGLRWERCSPTSRIFSPPGLFYFFFAAGLIYFAVLPAAKNGSIATALLNGAFLGFLGYMTFDLTNLAVLRLWSVKVAVMDISWGTFASAIAAGAGFAALTKF